MSAVFSLANDSWTGSTPTSIKRTFSIRKKLGDDAPLRWSDLEEAVSLLTSILNRCSAAYDGKLYKLEPLNAGDLDDPARRAAQGAKCERQLAGHAGRALPKEDDEYCA